MNSRIGAKCGCAVAAATIILTIAAVGGATTIERMSIQRLAREAPVIVRARCEGSSVVQDAGEIWTVTSLNVEEVWRGAAPAQITVRLLGGRWGEITSHVSGVPQFRAGEEVVLFLAPAGRGDFSVVSWEQGTFRIRRGGSGEQSYVTQDTAAFATFDTRTRTFRLIGIRNLAVDRFRAQVQAALNSGEVKQP
jgi:hypothetical protein